MLPRVLNRLETEVLEAIAAQHPEQEAELLAQFQATACVGWWNSGAGFFTTLAVDRNKARPITLPSPIGNVWADIDGFEDPMGFVLFLQDGYVATLEGFTIRDQTAQVAFNQVSFALCTS